MVWPIRHLASNKTLEYEKGELIQLLDMLLNRVMSLRPWGPIRTYLCKVGTKCGRTYLINSSLIMVAPVAQWFTRAQPQINFYLQPQWACWTRRGRYRRCQQRILRISTTCTKIKVQLWVDRHLSKAITQLLKFMLLLVPKAYKIPQLAASSLQEERCNKDIQIT